MVPRPDSPPPVREPAVRLVFSDVGLPDLFVHAATAAGMAAEGVYVDELADRLLSHLAACGATRVSVADAPLLRKVGLAAALTAAGIAVVAPGTPADAAVTDVPVAIAETGTLALPAAATGWLACPNRVAVLEPKNFVADLIDWADRAADAPVLISGPIAMTVFVLQ